MDQIGIRIKKKREQQNLQLNDLAKRVGISPSGLSQIEKMKASPSLATIKAIATSLQTTVGELIGENEGVRANPIVKAREVQLIESNSGGAQVYQLSHHDLNKRMDNFLVKLPRGANSDELLNNYQGQHFCHIHKGKTKFTLDETLYNLNEGDNASFMSKSTFRFENEHWEALEIIWTICQ